MSNAKVTRSIRAALVMMGLVTSTWSSDLGAQEQLGAREVLEAFRAESTGGQSNPAAKSQMLRMLTDESAYRISAVDSLVEGLRSYASAPEQAVRIGAVVWLSTPSNDRASNSIARLREIYRNSRYEDVKAGIIQVVPRHNAAPTAAIDFLKEIAIQEDSSNLDRSLAARAVAALGYFGSAGIRARQDLQRSGRVRDPQARQLLERP